MTHHRSLAEVGLCLTILQEQANPTTDPQRQFEDIENTAIAILDSEFNNYFPGALEEYLQAYLHLKQLELGLNLLPAPQDR